jgi:precorrin-2 dehydrogenase/sirohydrochlorin ferrochelatase/precorrin-6A/cobalt-precorrin-6A reductase
MRVFIFAGTSDGNRFILALLSRAKTNEIDLNVDAFCATEYGAESLKNRLREKHGKNVAVHHGRLDEKDILRVLLANTPDYVVDCTHPFAVEVTKNIKTACDRARRPYLRLHRETKSSDLNGVSITANVHYFDSMEEAAGFLKDKGGNILLTIGTKELRAFSDPAFAGRIYPRILPTEESLRLCRRADIPEKNIIAMQGPFSEYTNRAMIRQINACWLVSKETGLFGGYYEKLAAVWHEHISAVVINSPKKDGALDEETILQIIAGIREGKRQYFPVFQNIRNKKFLIVGSGDVALRRLRTLLRFDCFIEIIAPAFRTEFENLRGEQVILRQGVYKHGCCNADFVIAATDDRAVNYAIGEECRKKHIPVSVADKRAESSFFFPAVVDAGNITVGVTSGGLDHNAARDAARAIRNMFGEIG